MAVIRRVSIVALSCFALSSAMFKKGSKQLMEEVEEQNSPLPEEHKTSAVVEDLHQEHKDIKAHKDFPALPPLGALPPLPPLPGPFGDVVKSVADTINKTIEGANGAVDAATEAALGAFQAGADQVKSALDVVGADIVKVNSTAMGELKKLKAELNMAKDKAMVFAQYGLELFSQVTPQFDAMIKQFHEVLGMADKALEALGQDKAATTLDDAMSNVFATVDAWQSSVEEVVGALQDYANDTKEALPNTTNDTTALLLLSLEPQEHLAQALKTPLDGLSLAAGQFHDIANQTFNALNSFVDAGLEAAAGKLPSGLMNNVSEILEGVQSHALQQLSPIEHLGDDIVDGFYATAQEAGMNLQRSSCVRYGLSMVGLVLSMLLFK